MGTLDFPLDAKAQQAIALAKAIARSDGDRRLDAVHVVKAALLAFPEESARPLCRSAANDAATLVEDYASLLGEADKRGEPMALSRTLSRIVRKFGREHGTVTLGKLLVEIVREPDVRVMSLLKSGAEEGTGTRHRDRAEGPRRGYRSRRDWLTDLRTEWMLRKTAARQACDLWDGFHDDGWDKPCAADHCLDSLVRVAATNRSRAAASPASYDPLLALASDLDEVQRGVCEGVLVHQLYGMSDSFCGGVPVRALAQMLGPEIYPGNCRKVLEAVEYLEKQGVLTREKLLELDRLSDRVALAEYPLDQLLAELENDAISAGEFNWIKRRLRHDAV